MPLKRTGLGKGLDALIPINTSAGVTQIAVDSISPNPRQPRSHFDPEEITELAASIREYGVIQPLLVTHAAEEGEYVLIAGQRRLMAARQADLERVPVIVREASDQELIELTLIENVQRADLSPLETAEAYRQLAEDFLLSHDEIAVRVGKSRVSITNTLRLLRLPIIVQQALADEKLTEGHARALLSLATTEAQVAALNTIIAKDLNVRQTEDLVRKLLGQRPKEKVEKPPLSPEFHALEERLRSHLGTKVNLSEGRKGGSITIHYYSDEELNALVGLILGE
jgi:ParB family chromosome partitioning protein